jgi:hypothetical protein
LIGATSGKKPLDYQDEHNFKQLSGWMSQWNQGRVLTGSNTLGHPLSMPMDDFDVIMLISIVRASGACVEFHDDMASELQSTKAPTKTVLCVTIPELVLVELAQMGGSALDLALLLRRVARSPHQTNSPKALLMLKRHREAGKVRAFQSRANPSAPFDYDLFQDMLDFFGWEARKLGEPPEPLRDLFPPPGMAGAVLNDVGFEAVYRLGILRTEAILKIRETTRGNWSNISVEPANLDGEKVLICVGEKRAMDAHPELLERVTAGLPQADPDMNFTVIQIWLASGAVDHVRMTFHGPPRQTTRTAEVLKSVARERVTARTWPSS